MKYKDGKDKVNLENYKKMTLNFWPFAKKEKPIYNLKNINVPRTSGKSLRILVGLLRTPGIRLLLIPILLKQGGLPALRKSRVKDYPIMVPSHPVEIKIRSTDAKKSIKDFIGTIEHNTKIKSDEKKENPIKQSLFQPETAADFHQAYLEEKTTPVDVAMRLLDIVSSIEESAVPLRPFIAWEERELMKQARASKERYERGEPLGILDGVPICVKDELDMPPFKTMIGTKFYNSKPPDYDATSVSRLRSSGALMVGKTNMHEIGLGVTGLNVHYGTTRNPHHLDHYPGGSSSGSAAAVSAGLSPIALGLDGGGSIRIPASLCGVVGLKTTWGRISSAGAAPLSWSVSTVGPITSSANDAALAYSYLAGPDPRQAYTENQPPVDLQDFNDSNLKGIKLGIFSDWFNHASNDIVENCEKMIEGFKSKGAIIKEVEIPELNEVRIAQIVTIATEMLTSLQNHFKIFRQPFGLDALLNLTLAKEFKGSDYVKAQRIRAELIRNLTQIFKYVDAIVSPTTACTAPPIINDSLLNGESDLRTLTELMRYAPAANIGGFPAISFPVGYDVKGLPVGMQIMGRPWSESFLLRMAKISEEFFIRHPPMMRFSLLPD